MKKNNGIKDFLNLNYTIHIQKVDDEYLVKIIELNGCFTVGKTKEQALELIEDAKKIWIEACIKQGKEVPMPRDDDDYSGKILLRMPKALHRVISQEAANQGVSINQYLLYLVSSKLEKDSILNEVKKLRSLSTAESRMVYAGEFWQQHYYKSRKPWDPSVISYGDEICKESYEKTG